MQFDLQFMPSERWQFHVPSDVFRSYFMLSCIWQDWRHEWSYAYSRRYLNFARHLCFSASLCEARDQGISDSLIGYIDTSAVSGWFIMSKAILMTSSRRKCFCLLLSFLHISEKLSPLTNNNVIIQVQCIYTPTWIIFKNENTSLYKGDRLSMNCLEIDTPCLW